MTWRLGVVGEAVLFVLVVVVASVLGAVVGGLGLVCVLGLGCSC